MPTAVKTNPSLWKEIVALVKQGGKYGKPGTWNARKAQYAVKLYKQEGGGYRGSKSSSNSLVKWTRQDWMYSSSKEEGKGRYLPKKVWSKLDSSEKAATNKKKRQAKKKGKTKAKYSAKVARLVREA